jgi:hypothetical protein
MMAPPAAEPLHSRTDHLTVIDLQTCARLSGEETDRPLGIAFVLALRTLIESEALPGGAIMLGHRATWHAAPSPGVYRTEMSIISVDPPRTRYQRVVIGYRTAVEGGAIFVDQQQEVLWPTTA